MIFYPEYPFTAKMLPVSVTTYLRSLCLNPPHTSGAVDDRVLRDDLAGVDLTEGPNDTSTGEDHIPTNVS